PADSYLAPAPGEASSNSPGGGAPAGPAIVNVGPRFDELYPAVRNAAVTNLGDAAAGAAVDAKWWRERGQADALKAGDVSHFLADVDFAKLAAGTRDDSGVPTAGPINRIL